MVAVVTGCLAPGLKTTNQDLNGLRTSDTKADLAIYGWALSKEKEFA
jgi:hypothetical protein